MKKKQARKEKVYLVLKCTGESTRVVKAFNRRTSANGFADDLRLNDHYTNIPGDQYSGYANTYHVIKMSINQYLEESKSFLGLQNKDKLHKAFYDLNKRTQKVKSKPSIATNELLREFVENLLYKESKKFSW